MKKSQFYLVSLYNVVCLCSRSVVLAALVSCVGCKSGNVEDSNKSIDQYATKSPDSLATIANQNSITDSTSVFDLGILKDAPMLPLEDADIKEVYDHYILQDSANSNKYHLYDGNKQQAIEISPDEKFEISGNQKFMTRCIVKGDRYAERRFLDFTMLNTSNEVVYKGIIPAIGEDNYESHDYVYPLNNGKGFVIHSEEADILTLFKFKDSKLREVGKIKKRESIIVDFKMTDDGSDIVCLDYNEESRQYTLANYGPKQDKFSLKWEKKLNGKTFEFSQFLDNHYHYFDNSYQIDMVKQLHDAQFGIEVYDLSGNHLLDKKTTERLYFESYKFGNKIDFISTNYKIIGYFNNNSGLQLLNLNDAINKSLEFQIKIKKIISTNDSIFVVYHVEPITRNKGCLENIISGIAVLPKSDLSKGKFYSVFKKNTLNLFKKNDSMYFLKGWSSQFPSTVKKTGFPISN